MINLGDMFWSWLASVIFVMAPFIITAVLHATKLIPLRSEILPTTTIAAMGFVTIMYLVSIIPASKVISTEAIVYFSGLMVIMLLAICYADFLIEKRGGNKR